MHREADEHQHPHDHAHGDDHAHPHDHGHTPHEHGHSHAAAHDQGHTHDGGHAHGHAHSHAHEHGHDQPGDHHDQGHDHHDAGERRGVRGVVRGVRNLLVIGLIVALVYGSCFFVDQTEYVYVTEFGRPVRLEVEPGLKFKLPYQAVRRFDRRLQMVNPPGSQMLTQDKQQVSVGGPPLSIEWYACWRLPSPEFATATDTKLDATVLQFLRSVGTKTGAQDRLRERIDSLLKAKVGRMSLAQFVSLQSGEIQLEKLAGDLTQEVRQVAIEQFGIEIVDVRIKRFNHPEGVKPAIFEFIREERRKVAEKYRTDGKSEATKIKSGADKLRAQITSKAAADAERIRGEGEAEAMRIANEAYGQTPQAARFYQLLKTFETYRAILNERTTVILSADSNLLKPLTEGVPAVPKTSGPSSKGVRPAERKPAAPAPASNGDDNQETSP